MRKFLFFEGLGIQVGKSFCEPWGSRGVQNKEGGDTLFAVKNAQLYKQAVSLPEPQPCQGWFCMILQYIYIYSIIVKAMESIEAEERDDDF